MRAFLLFVGAHVLFSSKSSVSLCDSVGTSAKNCKYSKGFALKHFWKSTGLSPPDPKSAGEFLLSRDERFNLVHIGALPHHGIRQVRIHWLLNLITYNETEKNLNFTSLDFLMDFLFANNLRPGFELMGLPLNANPAVVKKDIYKYWYELIETIAKRYIGRFGYEEVQKWRFETMNEPDLKMYNFLNFTAPEYLEYFKACTNALHDVSALFSPKNLSASRGEVSDAGTTRRNAGRTRRPEDESNNVVSNESDELNWPKHAGQVDEKDGDRADAVRGENRANELGRRVSFSFDARTQQTRISGSDGRTSEKQRGKGGAEEEKVLSASSLRVGGPAGLFKRRDRHPLCWGVLDLCNRTGCHLHFLSFHKKGEGSADRVLAEDISMLESLRNYEFAKDLSIANDEADILTNWSLDKEWRADVWYAALISKVIIDHFKEVVLKRNVSIEVLSNDNAFLNYSPFYFTQRTLLARFQMNNTSPPHVQFIKKPVFVTMGLLSMLGDEFLPTEDVKIFDTLSQSWKTADPNINVLYTKRSSKYANVLSALVVAVDNQTLNNSQPSFASAHQKTIALKVDIHNLIEKSCLPGVKPGLNDNSVDPPSLMVTYAMDNDMTNPYQVWQQNKSPDFPDKALRKLLRQHEGPFKEKNELRTGEITVAVKIPSIHLINICVDPSLNVVPGEVINLRGYYVTKNEILLTWSDQKVLSRCIKSYEVEYQPSHNSTFQRINTEDLILLSFQHDESVYSADFGAERETNKKLGKRRFLKSYNKKKSFQANYAQYRVRAVDYWDRPEIMFHCYYNRKDSDQVGVLPGRTSLVSLIPTRSNYSTILTIGAPKILDFDLESKRKREKTFPLVHNDRLELNLHIPPCVRLPNGLKAKCAGDAAETPGKNLHFRSVLSGQLMDRNDSLVRLPSNRHAPPRGDDGANENGNAQMEAICPGDKGTRARKLAVTLVGDAVGGRNSRAKYDCLRSGAPNARFVHFTPDTFAFERADKVRQLVKGADDPGGESGVRTDRRASVFVVEEVWVDFNGGNVAQLFDLEDANKSCRNCAINRAKPTYLDSLKSRFSDLLKKLCSDNISRLNCSNLCCDQSNECDKECCVDTKEAVITTQPKPKSTSRY